MTSFSAEDWEQLSQLAGLLVVVDIHPRWAGVSPYERLEVQLAAPRAGLGPASFLPQTLTIISKYTSLILLLKSTQNFPISEIYLKDLCAGPCEAMAPFIKKFRSQVQVKIATCNNF